MLRTRVAVAQALLQTLVDLDAARESPSGPPPPRASGAQALGKKAHDLEASIQQAEQAAAKKLEALDEAPRDPRGPGPSGKT